jgi:hypothetical protein
MGKVGEFLLGLVGSAIGLTISIFMLFGLPLNVIALMRLMGWEWWTALIGAVVLNIIPLIGQIAYFIFAIIGAYYLWTADFNWRKAVNPMPETISLAQLSPERFADYKIKVIRPGIERGCMSDAKERSGIDGKVPVSMSNFCICYANLAVTVITQDDLVFLERTGQYSDDMTSRMKSALRDKCMR